MFSRMSHGIEPLESRILLTVALEGDVLRIIGDAGVQIVEITEAPEFGAQGRVRFDATGNGSFEDADDVTLVFSNVRTYVIDLQDGNDSLTFRQWRSLPATARSLQIDLGAGHDTFTYSMSEGGSLYSLSDGTNLSLHVIGGPGDDNVSVALGGLSSSTAAIALDLGDGNDVSRLSFLYRVAGTVTANIVAGAGDDTIDVYFDAEDHFYMPGGSRVDVNAYGGIGNDIVTAVSYSGWRIARIDGPLRVGLYGEAGTDYVNGSLRQMEGDFTVTTDASELTERPGLPAATISGRVYWTDPAEQFPFNIRFHVGWTVYLDADNDAQLDPGELSTTTGSGGNYNFILPTHGVYTVRVIVADGWQVQEADGYHIDTQQTPFTVGNDFLTYAVTGQPAADETLIVTGTEASDIIQLIPAGAAVQAIINGVALNPSLATQVLIEALGGDDQIIVDPAVAVRLSIFGGDGNDLIQGSSGDDTIYGNFGGDSIYSGSGNDQVRGGIGRDLIYAGDGGDNIISGNGMDSVYAGGGNDWIEGKGKGDVLYGGMGNDTLTGGAGDDLFDAGDGDDLLIANDHPAFHVTLRGGLGHDRYVAGPTALLFDVEEAVVM